MSFPSPGIFLFSLLLLGECSSYALPPTDDVATSGGWIEWDRSTDAVVSAPGDRGAAYPRAKQLSNGEILLAYHHGERLGDFGNTIALRKSRDDGATWYETQQIDGTRERGFWGFCNPDFIELGNGRILLVSAARGKPEPGREDWFESEGRHSGLRVRFSDNYGATWGPPQMVAAGRGRVWEPSIVRLSSGELEIYYANESPNLREVGAQQCIEAIRSADDGRTWTHPIIVSENPHCRNGMPAALALSNGHVVCAQEVVGLRSSPWIADTLKGKTDAYRLAQNRYDFGAAPFLTRLSDGSTLLAFHSQALQGLGFKQIPKSWMFSQIYIQHGDADAKNFGSASCPWPPPEPGSGSFFPSLLTLNDGSLVALSSSITVHQNQSVSTVVRWIKGRVLAGSPRALLGKNGSEASQAKQAVAEPDAPRPEYRFGPPDTTPTN